MTLTPVPLSVPRSVMGDSMPVNASTDSSGNGTITLQPLAVGAPDTLIRLQMVLQPMAKDLLGRVMLDR